MYYIKVNLQMRILKPGVDRTLRRMLVTTYQDTNVTTQLAVRANTLNDTLRHLTGECSFLSQRDIKFHINSEYLIRILVLRAHNWYRVAPLCIPVIISYVHSNTPIQTVTALTSVFITFRDAVYNARFYFLTPVELWIQVC